MHNGSVQPTWCGIQKSHMLPIDPQINGQGDMDIS